MFPQSGAPMERNAHFQSHNWSYTLGSPIEGPSIQVSPHRATSERDAPFLEPSFIFRSPRCMSSLSGSPGGPLWREMPVSRAFFYTSSRVPSKGPLSPPGSPHTAPSERDALLCSITSVSTTLQKRLAF